MDLSCIFNAFCAHTALTRFIIIIRSYTGIYGNVHHIENRDQWWRLEFLPNLATALKTTVPSIPSTVFPFGQRISFQLSPVSLISGKHLWLSFWFFQLKLILLKIKMVKDGSKIFLPTLVEVWMTLSDEVHRAPSWVNIHHVIFEVHRWIVLDQFFLDLRLQSLFCA